MSRRFFLWLCAGIAGLGSHGAEAEGKTSEDPFAAFLAAFPPDAPPTRLTGPVSATLQEHAHPLLIAFWQTVGFGSFGDGFLHFVHPGEYETSLSKWMMSGGAPIPDRIPFARTAFGDLIYFRDLRGRSGAEIPASLSWDEYSDVSFLSVHYRQSEVITYGMSGFFQGDLQAYLDDSELALRSFYRQLRKTKPRADGEDCYFFVPALALGGSADVAHLDWGDCHVHLELLYQLATKGP